jgi:hypothetical protein
MNKVFQRVLNIPKSEITRTGVRGRQNGAFFHGFPLKIFIEKYFVQKSHKIKHEIRGSPG